MREPGPRAAPEPEAPRAVLVPGTGDYIHSWPDFTLMSVIRKPDDVLPDGDPPLQEPIHSNVERPRIRRVKALRGSRGVRMVWLQVRFQACPGGRRPMNRLSLLYTAGAVTPV